MIITDQIGRGEVLLPINHNINKFVIYKALFKIKTQEIARFVFASNEKNSHLSARMMAYTVQLLRHDMYCPIKAEIRQLITNCYSYDYIITFKYKRFDAWENVWIVAGG